jgi:copper chaperone CopZ
MIKKTFRIMDMYCANCSMRVESIEDDLPGIKQVSASYHKQQMVVEYDDTTVTDDQIVEAVKKKGYQAVLV